MSIVNAVRECKDCGTRLKYTDERCEVIRITFLQSHGVSKNIQSHFCIECAKKREVLKDDE